jgi:hypothetical protein
MAAETCAHENRGLPLDVDAGRHNALPSHLSEFETLAAAPMDERTDD